MDLWKWLNVGTVLGGVCSMMAGCGSGTPHSSSASNISENSIQTSVGNIHNPQSVSIPIHHVVLAKSSVPGYSGQQLELVDVQGKYAKNPNVGPFQGDNWTGQFQLRVMSPTGKLLSKLNLSAHQYTLFVKKFQFHFADYNGDGYADFALGQYAGSNGDWYELFTIKSNGLFELPTLPTSQLFASDFTYSPLFRQVKKNGFKIKYYDSVKAKWFQATYLWKNGEFTQNGLLVAPSNG